MSQNDIDIFLNRFTASNEQNQFIKLTLSIKRDKDSELKNIFVKPVLLKSGLQLSFIYRYPTRDLTKNYGLGESTSLLRAMLDKDFYKADLFTTTGDLHLTITKPGKTILLQKKATAAMEAPVVSHDKVKHRAIQAQGNVYLHQLGVTTAGGEVRSDMQDKYRQINKYVEIVDGIIKSADLPEHFSIVDMGAGKGYLTFALYDHLVNALKLKTEITGVELRQELVDKCNAIAKEAGFEGLSFKMGSIETTEVPKVDMLIALHACDIATDQAIYRGIKAGAKVIICAPCCHKQVRKQMHPTNDLKAIAKYGILEERQAEILTDTIRALILEAFGYKTKVFEFISTEHTPKNVIIAGVKAEVRIGEKKDSLEKIKNLKALFNIGYHQLEKLMEI